MADVEPAAGADQPPSPRLHHLVLYDGVCGLCNGLVQFILARDPRALFQFAALQSAPARDVLRGFGKTPNGLNTFFVADAPEVAAGRFERLGL
jgi:predicted DCC family thiol-disulfide oxidoreductase YuxK